MVSLRERDVVVRGLLEDPTVAASTLSNRLSSAQAASTEMRQLLTLSVPSAALGKDNATDTFTVRTVRTVPYTPSSSANSQHLSRVSSSLSNLASSPYYLLSLQSATVAFLHIN